jgi:homospermidine synthase
VQLIVNDGLIDSDPSTVQIHVTTGLDNPLVTLLRDEITLIGSLDSLVFKNRNLQNSLINKLQAVMSAIQSDDYDDAVRKLQMDVVGKTDGCALSGEPDKNDWIFTCETQQVVYTSLMNIITRITELIAD